MKKFACNVVKLTRYMIRPCQSDIVEFVIKIMRVAYYGVTIGRNSLILFLGNIKNEPETHRAFSLGRFQ